MDTLYYIGIKDLIVFYKESTHKQPSTQTSRKFESPGKSKFRSKRNRWNAPMTRLPGICQTTSRDILVTK